MIDVSIPVLIKTQYPDRFVVHVCRLVYEDGALFASPYLPVEDETLVRFRKTKIDASDLVLSKDWQGEPQHYDYPGIFHYP